MNSRQKRTLKAVLCRPVPKDLEWGEVVSLLEACGCDYRQATKGSGRKFVHGRQVSVLHEPHPEPTLKP